MRVRFYSAIGVSMTAAFAFPLTFHTTNVVGSVAHSATFSSVVTGTPLHAYTEGGLNVFVARDAYVDFDPAHGNPSNFSGGFHYPSGGADGATHISITAGGTFAAVDMTIGTGFFGSGVVTHLAYWGYNGATLLGSGSASVASGSQIGFTDGAGITDLYIGAYENASLAASATIGSFQAGALDNLRVGAPVPEPASVLALALGAGLLRRRRRGSA